jgi:hypothetical protein
MPDTLVGMYTYDYQLIELLSAGATTAGKRLCLKVEGLIDRNDLAKESI